jgi:hypothetical protein
MLCLLGILLVSPPARADCSDGEITATFLVSGVYEGSVRIDVLDAVPLGPVTDPSEAEMIAAIAAVLPGYDFSLTESVGHFRLFWAPVLDFGACAIVDARDGRVVFAGTVIWSGTGGVALPVVDSHPWSDLGTLATPPDAIAYIASEFWYDGYLPYAEFVDAALQVVRATDVLHSFADCDAYTVTAFIYTPTVGLLDPTAAVAVIIVSGRCGPPWNGQPVAVDAATLSSVRALFD